MTAPVPVRGIVLENLRRRGLYQRQISRKADSEGRSYLFDPISDAPMATEFAISRFLTPMLAETGLALFLDCDMLVRDNLCRLFESIDPSKAVSVVKHRQETGAMVKMDGVPQTYYQRKNWSSFMVFNCDHPSNRNLTTEMVNTLPGRDLHRFCWLDDDEIGELDPAWNWLAGVSDPAIDPKVVHHTLGVPAMPGFERAPFADEWWDVVRQWAA